MFISGLGVALESFEKAVVDLKTDDTFDFTIMQEEAYGPYMEEKVLDLDREVFSINGHFDKENVYEGAVIPLQNEEGTRFSGRVMSIGDEKVKIDLNHPLAGKDLHFTGKIIEAREAREEEIMQTIEQLTGGSCGCGCDSCGDDCNKDSHDSGCGCGCGHCH